MAKKNRKKSTFFSDFKAFITKGNVMDMAVGVVIGTAFSAIVNSLVKDIIMPLLNLATGNGVEGLSVVLNGVDKYLPDGTINPEAILWNYGNFLQSIINFLIIALCIFTTLRIIMNIKKAKDKIADMAKRDKKADEQVLTEQTQAAQEAVADVAEEVKEEKPAEEQAVVVQDVAPNEVTAEATESKSVEQKAEEPVEEKETQEDLLKQIRDLLATMQPQKKSEAKATSAKKSTKSAK
ncbi:MAG: large conductance mechanosensitive channel protein MscL [Clostridia bacterium]|nr:large conductance mechanosensitive channel protein MscL [Clostridia bacterium]